jgi:hypothetical protein
VKSENAKTIIGLIVIGIIVVATFLYGNSQRQQQLRNQDDAKHQQTARVTPSVATSGPTPGGASTSVHNTAPVATPSANTIQGGASGTKGTVATTSTPAASTLPISATSSIPETGASTSALLGVSFMVVAIAYWRSSRRLLGATMRTPRS